MVSRQHYRPPKYSTQGITVSGSSSPTVPTIGDSGDWHIQTVQKDQLTQLIVFSHYQNDGWVQMFSIPVSNPIPFKQTSWPNPTIASGLQR